MYSSARIYEQFKLEPHVFRGFALGTILFLYLSFTRGFIYIAVSFLVEDLGEIPTAALGLLPLLGLAIPSNNRKFWKNVLPFTIIIWLLTVYIQFFIIQIILLMVGFAILYGSLRFILLENSDYSKKFDYSLAILWLILMDQAIRATNKGTDPIMGINIISFLIVSLFTLIIFLILYINNSLLEDKVNIVEVSSSKTSNFAIFALFLNILAFFVFFANPGVFGLNLGLYDPIAITIFSLTNGLLVYLVLKLKAKWIVYQKYLYPLATLLLLISVWNYPWNGFAFILWIIGFISCLLLLFGSLEMYEFSKAKGLTTVIALGIIINIALLLQILLTEALFLNITIVILGGGFVNLAYFLPNKLDKEEVQ